jgi:hypothetical protein
MNDPSRSCRDQYTRTSSEEWPEAKRDGVHFGDIFLAEFMRGQIFLCKDLAGHETSAHRVCALLAQFA